MNDLYYDLVQAKNGDVVATENIIKRYNKYINFMMNRYEVLDRNTCYDEVVRNILNAIQKIKIQNF